MKCLHPHIRRYFDVVSGKEVSVEIPCGKCIACLHNHQDSWCIRLLETAKASKDIIYDTLTVRPSSMPVIDVFDVIGEREISQASLKLCKHYNFELPCLDRGTIRDWIKRGRENYFFDHGKRLNMKYFACSEYGPSTSRCHVHLLVFGVSYADWVTYFARPWRQDMGFTKTKLISGRNKTLKDRQCVTRYVSKYVSKGVFESPLVKDGLLPKPFRCISHGIGAEYLNRSQFDIFRSSAAIFWKGLCANLDNSDKNEQAVYCPFRGKAYPIGGIKFYDSDTKSCFDFGNVPLINIDLEHLSNLLCVYYDSQGFPHPLPRYYKSKLLRLDKPNMFSCRLQELLRSKQQSDLERRYLNTAVILGLDVSGWDFSAPYYGLKPSEYSKFVEATIYRERENAKIAARNRFVMLKNHYKRILTNPQLSLYF